MIPLETLGQELVETRRQKRMTLRRLAGLIGVDVATLNRTEHGRDPSARHYITISSWIEDTRRFWLAEDECCWEAVQP